MARILDVMFGGGRNVIAETAQVFRENSNQAGARAGHVQMRAMAQFGDEFRPRQRGVFDRLMDGVNRVPRPAMALGCIGLFVAAMVDPIWFSMRMQGLGLVPEPLWWLFGVIVSFYFGARHQAKGQAFQQSIAQTLARTPLVVDNIAALEKIPGSVGSVASGVDAGGLPVNSGPQALARSDSAVHDDAHNAALTAWRQSGDR